jgi:hypothetical protein
VANSFDERPVDVKAHFHLLLSVNQFPFSQAASVAVLPSALFCERYSLGAWWVFPANALTGQVKGGLSQGRLTTVLLDLVFFDL